jgi:YD repeat-containing protein
VKPAGSVIATVDALERRTTYKYNDRNLLTETLYPDGTPTKSVYDDGGNRIRSVDQLGRETHFVHDVLDQGWSRRLSRHDAGGLGR